MTHYNSHPRRLRRGREGVGSGRTPERAKVVCFRGLFHKAQTTTGYILHDAKLINKKTLS